MTNSCPVWFDRMNIPNRRERLTNMNYEIVNLQEKIVAGIAARTNNHAPDMGAVIGGLWHRFYQDGIYENIPRKGTIKRTELSAFDTARKGGLIALTLEDGDELAWVRVTNGSDELLVATRRNLKLSEVSNPQCRLFAAGISQYRFPQDTSAGSWSWN